MKYLFIIFLSTLGCTVQAQQKAFSIRGELVGEHPFKYAMVYNEKAILIKKVEIIDNKFKLEGLYSVKQRFGALPHGLLLFAKEGEPLLTKYPSKLRQSFATIQFGEPIELSYQTAQQHFILKGAEKNLIQQEFNEVYWRYRYHRDSIFARLITSNKSEDELTKEKVAIDMPLFKRAIFENMEAINRHPHSEVSLNNFSMVIYSPYVSAKTVLDIFNNFPTKLKESEYGKHMFKDVEDKIKTEAAFNSPAYTLGMILPAFELPNQKGELVKSTSVFKKYTLIDFWATWCGPCREETPNLRSAFEAYQKKGFQIITISVDEKTDHAKWLATLKSDQMEAFTNLFNDLSKSRIVQQLNIGALPTNYLVDENGKIVAQNLRGEELKEKLNELMP